MFLPQGHGKTLQELYSPPCAIGTSLMTFVGIESAPFLYSLLSSRDAYLLLLDTSLQIYHTMLRNNDCQLRVPEGIQLDGV